jgi:hypothetical protein
MARPDGRTQCQGVGGAGSVPIGGDDEKLVTGGTEAFRQGIDAWSLDAVVVADEYAHVNMIPVFVPETG